MWFSIYVAPWSIPLFCPFTGGPLQYVWVGHPCSRFVQYSRLNSQHNREERLCNRGMTPWLHFWKHTSIQGRRLQVSSRFNPASTIHIRGSAKLWSLRIGAALSWAFDIEPAKTHHIQEPWSYPVYLTVSKRLMPNGSSVCSKLTHHGQDDSSSSSSSWLSTSCSFFFDRHHHHHTFISSRTFRDKRKNLISSDPQSIAALFASSPAPKSKIIRLNCMHAHTHAWWTQLHHICSGRLWAWATEFGPSDSITMRAC